MQRKNIQATITFLDLQNAFSEFHHHLLLKVLDYYHVPVELKSLIKDYYYDHAIFIGKDNYSTKLIFARKVVYEVTV